MNVVQLKPALLGADFPAKLRALADKAEAGQIKEFAAIYEEQDTYEVLVPSAPAAALLLASMLQHLLASKLMR